MKLLTITLAVLCLSSVYADPKTDILGKWTDPETGEQAEYKEQGRLEQTFPDGNILRGRYYFPKEGYIMIALDSEMMPMHPMLIPISIEGDEMQMVDSDGKKVKKLKREKAAKDKE